MQDYNYIEEQRLLQIVSELQTGSGLYTLDGVLSKEVCEELKLVILQYEPDRSGSVRCLLDKSPHFELLVTNPEIDAICRTLFGMEYRLSALSARVIHPFEGQAPEHVHVTSPHVDYPYRNLILRQDRANTVYRGVPLGLQVLVPLVDLTLETGATAYVPGSQTWYRAPDPLEFADLTSTGHVSRLIVPAGSATMWSGPLWHAAMPNLGLLDRIVITLLFAPPFVNHPHLMREQYSAEFLATRSERLRTLMCLNDNYPLVPPQPRIRSLM